MPTEVRITRKTSSATKPKAIGYVRCSTAEQVNGFGLEVQEQAIRTYAKDHGLRLLEVARDEGLSGSNGLDTRAGLAGALARLEAGEATTLVVHKLDRLARDLILQETLIQRLRAAEVAVLSVTEPDVDSDDHTRVLVRQVLGAISQYERAVIRSRMAAGKALKRAQGGYAGGRPPYGWRAVDGALRPDPAEHEIVEEVVRLRRAGASYRQICEGLAAAGRKPRVGTEWLPMTVRRIAERAGI